GEGRRARRDDEEARERLLLVGRRAVPGPRDQTLVGQLPPAARTGQGRSGRGREGPRRSPGAGAAGRRASGLDPGMSGGAPWADPAGAVLPVAGAAETYRVETWGCQMNVLDGQRMAGQLETMGLRRAGESEPPRVVLLNTCSVREKAESKVFSELGVLARRKQEDPDLVIGVTGCVAQVSGEEILERAPFVDFVAGTGQVERIGELVAAARRERRQALALELPVDDPVYQ